MIVAHRRVDRRSPVPLYEQIAHALRWMIAIGEIPRGRPLDPTREAAATWGVNRHTVGQAYHRLVEWGLVESHPPSRFLVVDAPSRDEVDLFVDEFADEARRRFGLSREDLADRVAGRSAPAAAPTVVVLECNTTQVQDHAAEIAQNWDVTPCPFVLDGEELPAGPVVCTFFHFEDVRERWPARLRDVRFIAVRPAEDLMPEAIRAADGVDEITIVAADSEEEARNLSADLAELFPPSRVKHRKIVREQWRLSGRPGRVTLVGPRAYEGLDADERARDGVYCVRYRIDPVDLSALGAHFGWSSR
jgi:DNA-binding transcriptional regulator YhcF (GntR family)